MTAAIVAFPVIAAWVAVACGLGQRIDAWLDRRDERRMADVWEENP